MKPKLPSPAMVVAMVALAVALSGTAVAAVNFASNAGAVDGKSAVASGAKLSSAAGKLVATQRSGAGKGRIASQYLDLPQVVRGSSSNFGRAVGVVDNAAGRRPADRLGARHRRADRLLQGREPGRRAAGSRRRRSRSPTPPARP